jgi:hypothetical protein
MERAVVVMAAVVERAAGCRVRGAVDQENRVGGFELEGLGHVRWGGDRCEALRRRNQIGAASRALIDGLPL